MLFFRIASSVDDMRYTWKTTTDDGIFAVLKTNMELRSGPEEDNKNKTRRIWEWIGMYILSTQGHYDYLGGPT